MQVSVRIPASIPLEVIEGALARLGCQIVFRKPKAAREFEPLPIRRRVKTQDGAWVFEDDEIDGLEVQKRIRKIESQRLRAQNSDGRDGYKFPVLNPRMPMSTADYVKQFCQSNNLK